MGSHDPGSGPARGRRGGGNEVVEAGKKKDPAWNVALVAAAMPFVFFGAIALRERVGGHWAAPGLLVSIVLFTLMASGSPRRKLAWASGVYGGGLSIAAMLIVLFPDAIMDREWTYPGRPERISTRALGKVVGNEELAANVASIRKPDELVASESYCTVHITRFHAKGAFPMTVMRIADGQHGLASLYWCSGPPARCSSACSGTSPAPSRWRIRGSR